MLRSVTSSRQTVCRCLLQNNGFTGCTTQQTREVKTQRSQQRWDQVNQRLDSEEKENARRTEQVHNAKVNRIQHFQRLEEEGQRRKDVRIGTTDQHLSMFQSTVLP